MQLFSFPIISIVYIQSSSPLNNHHKIAIGFQDGLIRILKIDQQSNSELSLNVEQILFDRHSNSISSMDFHQFGFLLSCSIDHSFCIWSSSIDSSEEKFKFQHQTVAHSKPIHHCQFDSNTTSTTRFLTVSDEIIYVWEMIFDDSLLKVQELFSIATPKPILKISFHPNQFEERHIIHLTGIRALDLNVYHFKFDEKLKKIEKSHEIVFQQNDHHHHYLKSMSISKQEGKIAISTENNRIIIMPTRYSMERDLIIQDCIWVNFPSRKYLGLIGFKFSRLIPFLNARKKQTLKMILLTLFHSSEKFNAVQTQSLLDFFFQ